jgi:DNA-binding LacI/PurR family transcriptional regulator
MSPLTINDIAKLANVSSATVSRVLSNSDKVKPSTRQKVKDIIDSQSYIPNHFARCLAGNPSMTIGVVIDELSNLFFTEIVEGIDAITCRDKYSLQMAFSQWIPEREDFVIRNMLSSHLDGIILAPTSVNAKAIDLLEQSGIPYVLLNCEMEDGKPFVTGDNYQGGKLVGEYLSKQDMEQIIVITGFDSQALALRYKGFIENYDGTTPIKTYRNISTFEDSNNICDILINDDEINIKKTTLFVTNDNVAIGIITRLKNFNIDIPNQVSIIGYDDIKISKLCRVPLTTVSQQITQLGEEAAKLLLDLISNKDTEKARIITPKFIKRDSSL